MKTQYVVGFLFNDDLTKVALIRKAKPAWQAGLLNGIGGKIEEKDDSANDAMIREFGEETGVQGLTGWWPFCNMSGTNNDGTEFEVWFFFNHNFDLFELQSPTQEKVEIHEVKRIVSGEEKTIGNLPWCIALALDFIKGSHPPKMIIAQY